MGGRARPLTSSGFAPSRSSGGFAWLWVLLIVLTSCWGGAVAPRARKPTERAPELIRAGPVGRMTSLRRQKLLADSDNFLEEQDEGLSLERLVRDDLPLLSGLLRSHGF